MKKLLLVVAAVCLVGFATSCKKTCECTPYAAGIKGTPVEYEIKSSEDCSQWVTYSEVLKTGVKCEKK